MVSKSRLYLTLSFHVFNFKQGKVLLFATKYNFLIAIFYRYYILEKQFMAILFPFRIRSRCALTF